jgi:hypothetical protein
MKFLSLVLIFLPALAYADMGGVDFNFAQGSRPSYSLDYEFNKDAGTPYLDAALSANRDYVQPYLSAGMQFEHMNLGLATAVAFSGIHNGAFNGQLTIGPEIGYMQNLTKTFYIKENNNYMGFNGQYNFGCTLSIGMNF